jgi:hypothetical protein
MNTKDASSGGGSRAEWSSARFLAIVLDSVDFGDKVPSEQGLRARIVEMTVFGKTAEAMSTIQASSRLNAIEASDLVERIGLAADQVFYATGLRP